MMSLPQDDIAMLVMVAYADDTSFCVPEGLPIVPVVASSARVDGPDTVVPDVGAHAVLLPYREFSEQIHNLLPGGQPGS